MLGNHDATGPAMCCIDTCPQQATPTPHRVRVGRARFVWLRFCAGCANELRVLGFLRDRAA